MNKRGVKVELSRADVLFLRQQCTGLITSLKGLIKAWDKGDGPDQSPSVKIWQRKLKQAERVREATNEALRK